jgi:hypothetical protein
VDRPVWVRRCRGCGEVDLGAMSGQPSLLEADGDVWRWRCAGCGGEEWEASGMWMPDVPVQEVAACPFLALRRS